MNYFNNNPLNMSCRTPLKRLGLSRKRKSCGTVKNDAETTGSCSGKVWIGEGCSDEKIQKQCKFLTEGGDGSEPSKLENIHDLDENKREDGTIREGEVKSVQFTSKLEKDIRELEDLYSTWVKGFKNALFYLIKLMEERQGEAVNVKIMLKDLRIWKMVCSHFENDPDLDFLTCDSESSE